MNTINPSKKIQFTIFCSPDNALESLDLTLSFDVTPKQILLDIFCKPTISFTYM